MTSLKSMVCFLVIATIEVLAQTSTLNNRRTNESLFSGGTSFSTTLGSSIRANTVTTNSRGLGVGSTVTAFGTST